MEQKPLFLRWLHRNTGEIKEEHQDFVKKVKGGEVLRHHLLVTEDFLKIDALMAEAKIDVSLMNKLAKSIQNLEDSAKALSPASDAASASQTYTQELAKSCYSTRTVKC